jgi:hypothetical protein
MEREAFPRHHIHGMIEHLAGGVGILNFVS